MMLLLPKFVAGLFGRLRECLWLRAVLHLHRLAGPAGAAAGVAGIQGKTARRLIQKRKQLFFKQLIPQQSGFYGSFTKRQAHGHAPGHDPGELAPHRTHRHHTGEPTADDRRRHPPR